MLTSSRVMEKEEEVAAVAVPPRPSSRARKRARGGVAFSPPSPRLLDEEDYLRLFRATGFWVDEEMCKELQKSPPNVSVVCFFV